MSEVLDMEPKRCPKCKSKNIVWGYGHAYGGQGAYFVCDDCGDLIRKEMDREEIPPTKREGMG